MAKDVQVIRLDRSHVNRATFVLARAFQDDPSSIFLVPDATRRQSALRWSSALTLRYCLPYDECYTTPDVDGVACWLPPDAGSLSILPLIRAGILLAPFKLGLGGTRRMLAFVDFTERVHHQMISRPHWYLALLGVEPSRQGCGIGSRLIRPILERADAAGLPCYLETQNQRNLSFYEKHGFRVVNEGRVPGYELRSWAMLREPG